MLIGIAALILAIHQRQSDPFQGHAVTNLPFTPLTYSVQTFLWWDANHAGMQVDMVDRVMNYSHIKQTFAWRDMEPERGVWDFSNSDRIVESINQRGLHVVARLGQVPAWASDEQAATTADKHDAPPENLDDWANYCAFVAARYQGQIAAYQIWNEPNLSREWGGRPPNAAEYVEILQVCSAAIRAVDPVAILISAGLAPTGVYNDEAHPDDIYLDAMYEAGFQQYVDVVGVHAPGYGQAPSYGPDDAEQDGRHRSMSFRRVEDLRKIMLQHGDAVRQIAIMEFGWTTDQVNPNYAWYAVTEAQQAQYIVEAYQYAAAHWRPWVGLMTLIYLPDPMWTEEDEEWWWSIVLPDGLARPAFFAIASMERYCGERTVAGWPPDVSEEEYLEQRDTCS